MNKRKLNFKWFGSLTNLTFRRSSGKASKSDDKGEAELETPSSPTSQSSVDDMDVRPRLPSYVRSSEMYSHMGTMPRQLSKKKDKDKDKDKDKGGGKGSRKSRAHRGAELGRSQSMRPMDHVCDSPLLSMLSSPGRPTMLPQAAAKPIATRGSPKKIEEEAEEGGAEKTTGDTVDGEFRAIPVEEPRTDGSKSPQAGETVQPGGHLAERPKSPQSPSADTHQPPCQVVLPMKRGRKTEEQKDEEKQPEWRQSPAEEVQPAQPESDQQRETDNSQMDPSGNPGEYVQFSKEKYLLESPPEKLRKELEEELKLSSTDMRSHGWYHGHIPREVSETLVLRNGDFLVRDSLVNASDYVLTSRWNHEVQHARITKVLVKSSETHVQFVLEGLEGEAFDSVPALVRSYVGNRRPVSPQSGAQIYCPINRTLPLRYLEATFALANGRPGATYSPSNQRGAYIKRRSVTMTDGLTTEKAMQHSPSTIHHHKESMRNCALSMDQIQEFRCPLSPVGEAPLSPAYSAVSRHRHGSGGRILAVIPPSPAIPRRSSDPHLSPSASNNNLHLPPSSSSSSGGAQAPHLQGPDPAGSYCELRPHPPCAAPGTPCKSYVERLRVEEGRGGQGGLVEQVGGGREAGDVAERESLFALPQVETSSSLRPSRYQSALLPAENKPLEMAVLKRVKELLAETDARTAAMHITKTDCTVARILGVTKEMQRMMGVGSGLELLTLPHGHQLRLDLLERFYTMSIMVAVDILGCTGSTEERAALLHKTIQLAAELKSTMGNMFGFAAVMRALELPQISRLEQTWMALRQRHTEGAILYEKKLKPFLKAMNDGKESCVLSNTSFPPVVPLLSLLERGVAVGEGLEPWESVEAGVDVVMSHLEAARTIAHHGGIYRSNAETKLKELPERVELLEIFCTEFQMRLLWGSRGSEGSQAERYEKFDKVLTALSHKLEPPVRHSEL
ncbi:SH2 domain-containing protein 3C isoform X2 [Alosa pseudoharengus]|uniref:SH2 domain-containing protein 3C isoform X2 n=1 Tax=Alosa pseudoharengus TaxID=34774 RepID=UPI003F8A0AE9